MRSGVSFLVFVGLLFQVGYSAAQQLPLGGRTASMGGAGAAAGRDAAMPYINPAGFGLVPHHTLSLSASLYRKQKLEIDEFFYFGELDPDLEALGDVGVSGNGLVSETFSTFPGAANVIWHFGPQNDPDAVHHVLSLSFIVPRSEILSYKGKFTMMFGDGLNTYRHTISNVSQDTDYMFGPVYAIKAGSFRLGLSAFLVYGDRMISQETSTNASLGADYLRSATTYYSSTSILGFQPILGAQWNPVGGFSVGLSGAPPSFHIWGETDGQITAEQTGPPVVAANFVQLSVFDGEYKRVQPGRLRLGLAYEVPRSWAVALDGEVTFPHDKAIDVDVSMATSFQQQGFDAEQMRDDISIADDKELGFSLHLGGEVFLSDMFSLRAGASYRKANDLVAAQAEDVLDMQVDYYTGTLGLGIEDELGETTLGFQFDYGVGRTVAEDYFRDEVERYYEKTGVVSYTFVFFISGAFDLQEFEAVIKAARNPEMLIGEQRYELSLGEVHAHLEQYRDMDSIAGAVEANDFSYSHTGVQEIDTVLKRIARMKALMVLARSALKDFELEVLEAQRDLAGEKKAAEVLAQLSDYALEGERGAQWKKLKKLPELQERAQVIRLAALMRDLLQQFGLEAAQLPRDVQVLIDQAPERFAGQEAIFLPAVARSLGSAENDVAEIAKEIPALHAAFGGAMSALAQEGVAQ